MEAAAEQRFDESTRMRAKNVELRGQSTGLWGNREHMDRREIVTESRNLQGGRFLCIQDRCIMWPWASKIWRR
jgi:hypothetical protein